MLDLCNETSRLLEMLIKKASVTEEEYAFIIRNSEDKLIALRESVPSKFMCIDLVIKEDIPRLAESLQVFLKTDTVHVFPSSLVPNRSDHQTWEALNNEINRLVGEQLVDIIKKWDKETCRPALDELSDKIKDTAKTVYQDMCAELKKVDVRLLKSKGSIKRESIDLPSLNAGLQEFSTMEVFYKEMSTPKRIGLAVSTLFWAPFVLLKKPNLPVFKSVFANLQTAKSAFDQYSLSKFEKNPLKRMNKRLAKAIDVFIGNGEPLTYVRQRLFVHREALEQMKSKIESVIQAYRDQIKGIQNDTRKNAEIKAQYAQVNELMQKFNKKITSLHV